MNYSKVTDNEAMLNHKREWMKLSSLKLAYSLRLSKLKNSYSL